MELHERLYSLGQAFGPEVFDDPDSFRGALDDFLDEGAASTGDINLLADAVRLGAFRRMREMLASGATPMAAVNAAGDLLARERGSADVAGSRWACAVLGFATGDISSAEVGQYRTIPSDLREVHGTPSRPTTPSDGWPDLSTEPRAASASIRPPTQQPEVAPAKTSVAPQQAPVPAPEHPVAAPRRRGPWLVVIVVVAVLAVVSGVAWLSFGDDVRQGFDSTPAASSSHSTAHQTNGTTCWNGSKVASPDDCTVPRGEAGLRWVFPSFDRSYEKCYLRPSSKTPTPKRALRSWFCPVKPGSLSGTSYSEWPSSRVGVAKYDNEYPTPHAVLLIAGHRVGYRWRLKSPNSDGLYKVSFAYHRPPSPDGPKSWPYSSSVYAPTQDALDRTCAELIVRAPSTFETTAPPCS